MERNHLTGLIIGKAIEIHKELGPGLLESAYQTCLAYEIRNLGIDVEIQKPLPIVYKEIKLDHGYRIDILVANRVVLEIKHVEFINEVHVAQILTYMKFGQFDTGLLINFNSKILKDNIRRFVF